VLQKRINRERNYTLDGKQLIYFRFYHKSGRMACFLWNIGSRDTVLKFRSTKFPRATPFFEENTLSGHFLWWRVVSYKQTVQQLGARTCALLYFVAMEYYHLAARLTFFSAWNFIGCKCLETSLCCGQICSFWILLCFLTFGSMSGFDLKPGSRPK
jgi:hypothetical protein